ncbi:MAG TPA: hypothetical protein VGH28_10210 [Polyangiaceae bacterium]|jgi:hypothetical protein
MHSTRIAAVGLAAALVVIALAPQSGADPGCAWTVDYALDENLELTGTPMGRGNGVFPTGPGKVVLRFDGPRVSMLSYAMRERFTVKAHTVGWTTTVTSDLTTVATPDACSGAAEGVLEGRTIRWTTPVRGVHTDGTITCSGSFCGKFGAPAPGERPFHIAGTSVRYSPFVLSADSKTFTMQKTHVSDTTSPKQSSSIALAGREVRRTCAPLPPCAKH